MRSPKTVLRLFRRSFRLRQVSAGGCNACEADVNVLNTIVFDLSRFGVQFVASPRHADGLLVTGPVTKNMELALRKTYEATPRPKVVIAVGACAISGGMFAAHEEVRKGVDDGAARRPLCTRLPAQPLHDPRRAAAFTRPANGEGPFSSGWAEAVTRYFRYGRAIPSSPSQVPSAVRAFLGVYP